MKTRKEEKENKLLDSLQNLNITQILYMALLIAAFFLGYFFAKVRMLERSNGLGDDKVKAQNLGGGSAPSQPNQPVGKVDVKPGSYPALGNKDAKVSVIEFADFQCPFCERYYTQVEKDLIKNYVNAGKVKYYFRNFAFLGQESTWAAEGASCANEQNKFWEFHDYLYSHQGQENSGAFSKDNLKKFAASLNLNTDQFNQCLDSDKYKAQVDQDTNEGKTAGVNGTPTVYVNGTMIVGAQPYSAFQQAIDAELTK